MKSNVKRNGGFTLIETMIVILVIIVLAGMVFKLMGVAGAKNEEANTKATLQKLANALEEYRAIYGKYPPVYNYPGLGQPIRYEFANARYLEAEVGPEFAAYLKNVSKDKDIWSKDEGRLFTFGLLSYFVPRHKGHADRAPDIFVGGKADDPTTDADESEEYKKERTINQWEVHNVRRSSERMSQFDLQENIDSARKILPYLDGALKADGSVESYGIIRSEPIGCSYNGVPYRNQNLTIKDGWEREILYESSPPHDTYKLWSRGPDGRDDTSDDIVLTSE
jgi:type II secretory pathway pseudopilin PulG